MRLLASEICRAFRGPMGIDQRVLGHRLCGSQSFSCHLGKSRLAARVASAKQLAVGMPEEFDVAQCLFDRTLRCPSCGGSQLGMVSDVDLLVTGTSRRFRIFQSPESISADLLHHIE